MADHFTRVCAQCRRLWPWGQDRCECGCGVYFKEANRG